MDKGLPPYMRGRYCQFRYDSQNRFLEIYVIEYREDELSKLRRINCLKDSEYWKYLRLIDEEIPSNTKYLYRLASYVNVSTSDDAWEFNDQITNYQEFGFFSINRLLEFTKLKWGIKKEDFKPQSETDIP